MKDLTVNLVDGYILDGWLEPDKHCGRDLPLFATMETQHPQFSCQFPLHFLWQEADITIINNDNDFPDSVADGILMYKDASQRIVIDFILPANDYTHLSLVTGLSVDLRAFRTMGGRIMTFKKVESLLIAAVTQKMCKCTPSAEKAQPEPMPTPINEHNTDSVDDTYIRYNIMTDEYVIGDTGEIEPSEDYLIVYESRSLREKSIFINEYSAIGVGDLVLIENDSSVGVRIFEIQHIDVGGKFVFTNGVRMTRNSLVARRHSFIKGSNLRNVIIALFIEEVKAATTHAVSENNKLKAELATALSNKATTDDAAPMPCPHPANEADDQLAAEIPPTLVKLDLTTGEYVLGDIDGSNDNAYFIWHNAIDLYKCGEDVTTDTDIRFLDVIIKPLNGGKNATVHMVTGMSGKCFKFEDGITMPIDELVHAKTRILKNADVALVMVKLFTTNIADEISQLTKDNAQLKEHVRLLTAHRNSNDECLESPAKKSEPSSTVQNCVLYDIQSHAFTISRDAPIPDTDTVVEVPVSSIESLLGIPVDESFRARTGDILLHYCTPEHDAELYVIERQSDNTFYFRCGAVMPVDTAIKHGNKYARIDGVKDVARAIARTEAKKKFIYSAPKTTNIEKMFNNLRELITNDPASKKIVMSLPPSCLSYQRQLAEVLQMTRAELNNMLADETTPQIRKVFAKWAIQLEESTFNESSMFSIIHKLLTLPVGMPV